MACNADLSRISFPKAFEGTTEGVPTFVTDLDGIEEQLRAENVGFILVDGIFGLLGVQDGSKYTES